ncbi:MAG: hypothetical protein AB7F96_15375 [Beijerinckiaceae bacterium]
MSDYAGKKFATAVKRGNRRARAVNRIFRDIGITPLGERQVRNLGPFETRSHHTCMRLLRLYGEADLRLALRLLCETNEQNAQALHSDTIIAMTMLVSLHPDWKDLGTELFEAIDKIDVDHWYRLAAEFTGGRYYPRTAVLVGMLASEISRQLGEIA